jgi:hypothetical protein
MDVATVSAAAFLPFDPETSIVPASEQARATAALLQNRICQVKSAITPAHRDVIRQNAERKMASVWGGNLLALLGERIQDDVYRVDPSIFLALFASPCLSIALQYFQERCGVSEAVMIPMNLLARRFKPGFEGNDEITIPFHQDAFGVPVDWVVINNWVLMAPHECGKTSPGLEFVPDRFQQFIALEKNPTTRNYAFLETSHGMIEHYLAAYTPWRPSMELGDVIMFDGLALHRTYLHPMQTETRHSAEIRLVAKTPSVEKYLADNPVDHYSVGAHEMRGPSVIDVKAGVVANEWGSWAY